MCRRDKDMEARLKKKNTGDREQTGKARRKGSFRRAVCDETAKVGERGLERPG